jgi:pyruvate formate lyase activating enzyme
MNSALHWSPAPDAAVRCTLCPNECLIPPGASGRCRVRVNRDGTLRTLAWGRPAALAVDPVEKKPLYHFLPGSPVLSLGTLGCNLSCRFCQNDTLSRPDDDALADVAAAPLQPPDAVARTALSRRIPLVAFTYNEPTVFFEYALDTAAACRAAGLRTIAVTNGCIAPAARAPFFAAMDAANIDLKSFRDDFYRRQCGTRLQPVLDTLEWVRRETACWLEVTTLLIPGLNDTDAELSALAAWIADRLGPDTPLHFSAFHGACEMAGAAPTPPSTLLRARRIARSAGLRHVYLGNCALPGAADTLCPACGQLLVARHAFASRPLWTVPGLCPSCSTPVPGVWS